MREGARKTEEYTRGFFTGGTLFEELGFYYVGPIDGHDLDHLLPVLKNVRDAKEAGPILVHVVTKKGKGYAPAESSADKYHGVSEVRRHHRRAGESPKANAPELYRRLRREPDRKRREDDERIVAVNAAMPAGTGLDKFGERFPEALLRRRHRRAARRHLLRGLAAEGYKPFAAIYSTFLQRAYDQIVHDVAIQHLPVRFAIDRAGFVGADGPDPCRLLRHRFSGSPSRHGGDGGEPTRRNCKPHGPHRRRLRRRPDLVSLSARQWRQASICRSAGNGAGDRPGPGHRQGRQQGGASCRSARASPMRIAAAEELDTFGLSTTVADARFAKPLDTDLIGRLARHHEVLVTVEEGASGGFATQVLHHLATTGQLDSGLKIRPLTMPDRFVDHAAPETMVKGAALDRQGIVDAVFRALGTEAERVLKA